MKVQTILAAGCAALLSAGTPALAQFTSNFDNLTGNSTLSGQDDWSTDNTAQNDFVGVLPFYSSSVSDNWALLGGVATVEENPSLPINTLWRNFAPLANMVGFATRMAVIPSASPLSTRDFFSWTLSDSSGAPVVSVNFSPTTFASVDVLAIGWTDYTSGSAVTFTTPNFIPYSSIFYLEVSLLELAAPLPKFSLAITDSLGNPPIGIVSGASLDNPALDIGRVTASWALSDTSGGSPHANFGYNSIVFDNLSVTLVVPEPSVVAMLIVAAAGAMGAARLRRKSA